MQELAQCKGIAQEDLFDNNYFICPNNSEGPNCPAELECGRESRPGAGEMADVNKMPDSVLASMFFEPDLYELCDNLLDDPVLVDALSKISEAEAVTFSELERKYAISTEGRSEWNLAQRTMARVFAHVSSWSYCNARQYGWASLIHAYYDPRARDIVLYESSCHAARMYDVDLTIMSAGHRLHWIAAHELGHVIDELAGDLNTKPDAEVRATLYGSILAECASRIYRAAFTAAVAEGFERELVCLNAHLLQAEHEFARVRQRIKNGDRKTIAEINKNPRCLEPFSE